MEKRNGFAVLSEKEMYEVNGGSWLTTLVWGLCAAACVYSGNYAGADICIVGAAQSVAEDCADK